MKPFKIISFLIISALVAPSAYSETAVIGSILKQVGTVGLPADDITEFDFTDIITTGITADGGNADTLEGQNSAYHLDRANHTGFQIASTISDFNNATLTTSLSSGIDSHTPGDDDSCKVTRNSGDIKKFDIAACSVHIQGIDYPFASDSAVDPEFAGGDSDKWIGYDSSGLVKQDSGFTDVQKRTIMVIARIQAKVGQTGPGSDISDVGITDVRYLISEDDFRWHIYLENAIGALFETGGLITENSGTDRDLDLSAGTLWDSHRGKQTWNAFSNLSGLHVRHVGGVWSVAEKTLNMDNVNYDDGTDLTAMTNNNYHCSHTILMSPRGTQDADIDRLRLFWIHCQSEWNSLQGAIDSGLDFGPFVDQATSGLIPLAQAIVKKNSANIVSIIDARPRIGTAGGSITTAAITRQGAYNNGSDIMLSVAQGGIVISDNATPVGDLFKVNNFANTTSFFKVDPSGVTTPAIGINVAAGAIRLQIADADANTDTLVETYSTSTGHRSRFRMAKSASGTKGTLLETRDGESLGRFMAQGVNSGDARSASSVQFDFTQDGTAGATFVPGRLTISIGSDSAAATEAMRIASDKTMAIGSTTTGTAQLLIDQPSTTAAIPVLVLDQGDIDDTFVNIIGTSAADASRSISSDTTEDATKFGAFRVEINGVTKWIRVYDDPS